MTNEERQLLADIRKEASSGLSCITFGNNCISRLWQIVNLCDSVLDKPPVNNKQTTRKKTKMETNEKNALVLIANAAEVLRDMLKRGNADAQSIRQCENIINVARETIGSVAPTKGAKRGESK